MNKIFKFGGAFLLFFVLFYFAGPKPESPKLDPKLKELQVPIKDIESYVNKHEAENNHMKAGNEAKIIWAKEAGRKTKYSILYLHGFSASQQEGDPIHRKFARRYGANLFLARLHRHGLKAEHALKGLTVENYIESAKKAVNIARALGDSVIIMSTSTGSSLALYLAAHNPEIKGLICYSPNIRVNDPSAFLLNNPWGEQIAKMILGSDTYHWKGNDSIQAYWSTTYPVKALVTMQHLLENTMTSEVFKQVKQPVFMGYYYKSQKEQDNVVSVDAALRMFDELGSAKENKVKIPFPLAGHHVIASRHQSKDLKSIEKETYKFAESILGLTPQYEY
ncbi:alpha/beta hydrolase [Hyphobacterium sp. CCMP332]|nr:alpha/beta hydrolase [Hyphobacterium sp. CCMP332]